MITYFSRLTPYNFRINSTAFACFYYFLTYNFLNYILTFKG